MRVYNCMQQKTLDTRRNANRLIDIFLCAIINAMYISVKYTSRELSEIGLDHLNIY